MPMASRRFTLWMRWTSSDHENPQYASSPVRKDVWSMVWGVGRAEQRRKNYKTSKPKAEMMGHEGAIPPKPKTIGATAYGLVLDPRVTRPKDQKRKAQKRPCPLHS